MTYEDIQILIDKISYKDWKFTLNNSNGYLTVTADAPIVDIYHGYSDKIFSTLTLFCWENLEEKWILDQIFRLVMDMEMHEAAEHFCIDNARPFDPHGKFNPAPYTGKGFRYPSRQSSGFNTNYFNNITYSKELI